jgi:uncharacterized protein
MNLTKRQMFKELHQRKPRIKWYNYLLGGGIIFLLINIISIPVFFIPDKGDKLISFIKINLPFLSLVVSIFIVIIYYHRENFINYINYSGKIHLDRILKGFVIWFALLTLTLGLTLLSKDARSTLVFTNNLRLTIIFLLTSLFLTFIQVLAEELLFRSYLINFLKSICNHPIFIIIISAIIFSLPHMLNPEVTSDKFFFFLNYLLMGGFLTYLTLKNRGIEFPLGIHFANNFFTVNILNYPNSPLPSNPIFLDTAKINPRFSLLLLTIYITITILFLKRKKWLLKI